jgi:hypothetical protein
LCGKASDKKNFPCFYFAKQHIPLLRGKKRVSTWATHTRVNVDEVNIIAQKFSEISCDPTLNPTPEGNVSLHQLFGDLQNRQQHRSITKPELLRAANSARIKASSDSWRVSSKLVKWVCNSPILCGPLLSVINLPLSTAELTL